MGSERKLPGFLGALPGAAAAAPLAWLLLRSEFFPGLAGLAGFLLAAAGWRLGAGRSSGLGITAAALLTPATALPGLYYGCAELIHRANAQYGCTMEEALELVPTVALDPINRGQLLWAVGGVLGMDLLAAGLFARYLRLRRIEKETEMK